MGSLFSTIIILLLSHYILLLSHYISAYSSTQLRYLSYRGMRFLIPRLYQSVSFVISQLYHYFNILWTVHSDTFAQ